MKFNEQAREYEAMMERRESRRIEELDREMDEIRDEEGIEEEGAFYERGNHHEGAAGRKVF